MIVEIKASLTRMLARVRLLDGVIMVVCISCPVTRPHVGGELYLWREICPGLASIHETRRSTPWAPLVMKYVQ